MLLTVHRGSHPMYLWTPQHTKEKSTTHHCEHSDPSAAALTQLPIICLKCLASIQAPLVGNTQHIHTSETQDFARSVKEITLDPNENVVLCYVTSLFTCIHSWSGKDGKANHFTPDHICAWLDVCLATTYFYRQHICTMGSPVSPAVVTLYMEEHWSPSQERLPATGSGLWTTPGSKSEQGKWKPSQNTNAVDRNISDTHPPAMLSCVPSPGSWTTIHTWTHLSLMTHMQACWVNNSPQQLWNPEPTRVPNNTVRTLPHRV